MSAFRKNSRPTQEEILVIAKQINCTEVQIKNWYSNKRKKFRLLNKAQKAQALKLSHPNISCESNSSLSSGSTACFEPHPLVPSSWTDSSPKEAGQLSLFSRPESSTGDSSPESMRVAAQQTIAKTSLIRESQQQPIIDFGPFSNLNLSPLKPTQEFLPSINQFIPQHLNLSPEMTLRNTMLSQRNIPLNYLSLLQLPIMGQNIPNLHHQYQAPQLYLNGSGLPLLNTQKTDVQTLILNSLLARNQLIHTRPIMQ